jgi:hypothetical protein
MFGFLEPIGTVDSVLTRFAEWVCRQLRSLLGTAKPGFEDVALSVFGRFGCEESKKSVGRTDNSGVSEDAVSNRQALFGRLATCIGLQ